MQKASRASNAKIIGFDYEMDGIIMRLVFVAVV